jgi:tRNA(fMet)-specific endonuclease VapC
MSRLAFDANAIIAHLRDLDVPALPSGPEAVVPVTVLGELYAGAFASARRAANVAAIDRFIATRTVLPPDRETAHEYGRLRSRYNALSAGKRNDLWIAALCLQHGLPLLTNDRGFDAIEGLAVLHW